MAGIGNKILTWDSGEQINLIGPSWYSLCKKDSDSIDHIFVHCSFANIVWKNLFQVFKIHNHGDNSTMLDCFEMWLLNKNVRSYKSLPCYAPWRIQLSRNRAIFEGLEPNLGKLSHHIRVSFDEGRKSLKKYVPRNLQAPCIDITKAWGFFYGAS